MLQMITNTPEDQEDLFGKCESQHSLVSCIVCNGLRSNCHKHSGRLSPLVR